MARRKAKRSARQVHRELKELEKRGLYKPRTRYPHLSPHAEKIIERYRDVLVGRAKVVTVPAKKTARGQREARAIAKEIAETYSQVVRARGRKLIVKTVHKGERVTVSPAAKTISTIYTDKAGITRRHDFAGNIDIENLPELGEDQSYALPFYRGTFAIERQYRATPEEIIDLATEYEQKGYQNATGHIMIVSEGTGPVRRTRKRRKRKPYRKTNVVPFKRRRRK